MPALGIITNDQTAVFQRDVIAGACEVAASRGYSVIVDSIAESVRSPRAISLDLRDVVGVLALADAVPVDQLQAMLRRGIPVSLVSHRVPSLPIPAVFTDNVQGMAELARHVIADCGCRKPVYIGGLSGQIDGAEREAGFRRELLRHQISPDDAIYLQGNFDADTAAGAFQQVLASGHEFDAVVAADYLMARAALDLLRHAGRDVPGEVVVVGFGDGAEAQAAGLTTVAADIIEQGRRSARQLIGQIDGLHITGTTVLNVRLLVRKTSR